MNTKVVIGIILALPFLGILLWGFASFARDAIRRRDFVFFLILLAGLAAGVGVSVLIKGLPE